MPQGSKLYNCAQCGHVIAYSAPHCPGCGASNAEAIPKSKPRILPVFAVVALAVLIILWLMPKPPPDEPPIKPTPTPGPRSGSEFVTRGDDLDVARQAFCDAANETAALVFAHRGGDDPDWMMMHTAIGSYERVQTRLHVDGVKATDIVQKMLEANPDLGNAHSLLQMLVACRKKGGAVATPEPEAEAPAPESTGTPAGGMSPLEACTQEVRLVRVICEKRDQNVPSSELMKVAEGSSNPELRQVMVGLITEVYGNPKMSEDQLAGVAFNACMGEMARKGLLE